MAMLKCRSILTLTAVGAVIAAGSDSAFLGKNGVEVHANVFDCHSCDKCVVGNNPNNQVLTSNDCAPCAMGAQTWWPCNVPLLCACASSEPTSAPTASPEPAPEPTPAPTTPTPQPTLAPTTTMTMTTQVPGRPPERMLGPADGPTTSATTRRAKVRRTRRLWRAPQRRDQAAVTAAQRTAQRTAPPTLRRLACRACSARTPTMTTESRGRRTTPPLAQAPRAPVQPM
mmetsp:Transcript_57128/g.185024  ORF Transcript_57128/g.185024 Transcript_57128/m.185024 type:complete len:228 (+) Transcript_57128:60-743(+)